MAQLSKNVDAKLPCNHITHSFGGAPETNCKQSIPVPCLGAAILLSKVAGSQEVYVCQARMPEGRKVP